MRIEDNILITKEGAEVLTNLVPKEPAEIELIMNMGWILPNILFNFRMLGNEETPDPYPKPGPNMKQRLMIPFEKILKQFEELPETIKNNHTGEFFVSRTLLTHYP